MTWRQPGALSSHEGVVIAVYPEGPCPVMVQWRDPGCKCVRSVFIAADWVLTRSG